MKKQSHKQQLRLARETIAKLEPSKLVEVVGGNGKSHDTNTVSPTQYPTCYVSI